MNQVNDKSNKKLDEEAKQETETAKKTGAEPKKEVVTVIKKRGRPKGSRNKPKAE